MEKFFQTHAFWMEHSKFSVRRSLMDTIDWSYRLIGIRGSRGVGRTTFLLQYAKENFDPALRQCLFISMNNFYFHGRGLVEFAGEFVEEGGQVLLIDQAFKLPDWQRQLLDCYHKYPFLRIIFTTTPVQENNCDAEEELAAVARFYYLHGFSFREYVNERCGLDLKAYSLSELIKDHELIMKTITPRVNPWEYFNEYLRYGYYPFYVEDRNFTEKLLKAMNSIIEMDILFTKQIELKYLPKIKKLLYLLAVSEGTATNVSQLAEEIQTSRATVMNYLKYLEEGRFVNMVYNPGDSFPKKPAAVLLHDANMIYALNGKVEEQNLMEAFFVNSLWRHHQVNKGKRDGYYIINDGLNICVCDRLRRTKSAPNTYFARYNMETGKDNNIPLWLFGFLY